VKIALDTNILVYATAFTMDARHEAAIDLVQRLPNDVALVPVQALAELFNVLVTKRRLPRSEASEVILAVVDVFSLIEPSSTAFFDALELAAVHQFQIYDALILAAAAEVGCSLLLTEDMHEGFTWKGVTIMNPFKPSRHAWLDVLLAEK
jgi:predicted nucleic acid-binding protein